MWRWAFGVCLLLWSSSAAAQPDEPPPIASPQDQARRLAGEGIVLYEQGNYEQAIDRLERADALYSAPVHRVYIGRALARLGRLLAAEEAYRRAATQPKSPDEPTTFDTARGAARDELSALERRIPVLRLVVPDDADERLRVSLDDRDIPPSAWSHLRVDPGVHVIGMQLGDGPRATTEVDAHEGGQACVTLRLDDDTAPNAGSGGPSLLWPGVAFGVGGVGLILGGVTGVLALTKAADVADRCPGDVCPPDVGEDAGSADTLGAIALAGLITGGVGVAVGVTLVLVGGDEDASVAVDAGLGGAALRVRF